MNFPVLQKLYLALHRRVFARRLGRQRRFAGKRVISIGNLSAGGTGKTPAVVLLAQNALRDGHRPLVVLRGYRGRGSSAGILVSDGQGPLASARDAGDEAVLLAERLPGVRVAAGSDRAALIERFGADATLILLDDAFQNPAVFRDFDLVLIDSSIPPDAVRVFPGGHFREDLTALERAHAVLLTRVEPAGGAGRTAWETRIHARFPRLPVFAAAHRPDLARPAFAAQTTAPVTEELPAGPIAAFCGLGNPEAFRRTLVGAGLSPVEFRAFPDHHTFRAADLRTVFAGNALTWITTEKDLVRLRELDPLDFPDEFRRRLYVLPIGLEILDGRESAFLALALDRREET